MVSSNMQGEVYSKITSLNLQESDFCYVAFEDRFKLNENFVNKFKGKQPKWGPIGYVTYKRTYARTLENGLTEEFWQTLQRVVEGEFSFLKKQIKTVSGNWNEEKVQELAQETYQRAWDFKFLFAGRGLWTMGTEYVYKNGSASLQNCCGITFKYINENFAGPFIALADYLMLGVGCGYSLQHIPKVIIQKPVKTLIPHIVPDTRLGWCALMERILLSFIGQAELPENVDVSLIRPEGLPIKGFGGFSSGSGPLIQLYHDIINILTPLIGKPITSVAISDICNVIARCIVSGNVRRSAEIAIGSDKDVDFLKLKDPTEANYLKEQLTIIQNNNLDWLELEKEKENYKSSQKGLSFLNEKFLNLQAAIDIVSKAQKEILEKDEKWLDLNALLWSLPLNDYRWSSNNSVFITENTDLDRLGKQISLNGEPGGLFLDNMKNYGRMIDEPDYKDIEADTCNPCSEQTLHGSCFEQGWFKGSGPELCTLVETFPTKHESLSDYLKTLKVAYLYGKIVTCIPTHNIETNKTMSKHRRIGLSMAGVADMYLEHGIEFCRNWWETSYQFIRDLDKKYAEWMQIPESIKVTSLKPGGTLPLLCGVEGGMKFSSAPYYFRTIRLDQSSALISKLKNAGYRVEDDLVAPRTKVAYFPIKSDAKKFAEEISLEEQIKLCSEVQAYWSDNMVSCTLTFKPEEGKLIPSLLNEYKNKVKSVAFLPFFDHGFAQAPYIPCTQQEYEIAFSKLKPLDLSDVKAVQDQMEKFCEGDACLVKK